jgi:hypothetical protein
MHEGRLTIKTAAYRFMDGRLIGVSPTQYARLVCSLSNGELDADDISFAAFVGENPSSDRDLCHIYRTR